MYRFYEKKHLLFYAVLFCGEKIATGMNVLTANTVRRGRQTVLAVLEFDLFCAAVSWNKK